MGRGEQVLFGAALAADLAAGGALAGCSDGQQQTPAPQEQAHGAARATVAYDADSSGQNIGVYTYTGPWGSSEDHNGAFPHGMVITALCWQEGRLVRDTNVPQGAPPVETRRWLRFVANPQGEWSPAPYYDLGSAVLPSCVDVGLYVPNPAATAPSTPAHTPTQ